MTVRLLRRSHWSSIGSLLLALVLTVSLVSFGTKQPAAAVSSLVNAANNHAVGNSVSVTYSPAQAGNLLVVSCAANGSNSGVGPTITGPSGYTVATNEQSSASMVSQAMFYKIATAGSATVQCTFSSAGVGGIRIMEFSGMHNYMVYETKNPTPSLGNSTAMNTGTVTTTHAGDLLVTAGVLNLDGTIGNWSSPFTGLGNYGPTSGKKADRITFANSWTHVANPGSYAATATNSQTSNWRAQIIAFRAMQNSPNLNADIVNGSGVPVASPSVTLSSLPAGFTCQTASGTLGTTTEKIRVENTTDNPAWTLAIAATAGPTARWQYGAQTYAFNNPASTGCAGGQLTINPAASTLTGATNCPVTAVQKGAATSFSAGITNAITLLSASSPAYIDCYWDLIGIGLSQKVPANQASGTYNLNLTITVTAS